MINIITIINKYVFSVYVNNIGIFFIKKIMKYEYKYIY